MRVNFDEYLLSKHNKHFMRFIQNHIIINTVLLMSIVILFVLLAITYHKVYRCEQTLLLYKTHVLSTEFNGSDVNARNAANASTPSSPSSIQSRELPNPFDNILNDAAEPLYETIHRDANLRLNQSFNLLRQSVNCLQDQLMHINEDDGEDDCKQILLNDLKNNYVMPNQPQIITVSDTSNSGCKNSQCSEGHGPNLMRYRNLQEYNDYVKIINYDQVLRLANTKPSTVECVVPDVASNRFSAVWPSDSANYLALCDDTIKTEYCDMNALLPPQLSMSTFKSNN